MRHEIIDTGFGPVAVSIPNTTVEGDGFYISYNDCDAALYGSDTTALVFGQMQRFYILRGDHRTQYAPLIRQGFAACLDYYRAHIDASHPHSDKLAS